MAKSLNKKIYAQVKSLSEEGNRYLNDEDYDNALKAYMTALQLLPEPVEEWEATMWLLASIGDAYFLQKLWTKAYEAFGDAVTCAGGLGNPFVHLRLGEVQYELGDMERAKDNLARAYMWEGDNVFKQEDPKYFAFLKLYMNLP